MPVMVQRNFGVLADVIRTTKEDWYEVGILARELIIQRTRAGKDINKKAFTPYSQGYATQRRKAGLARVRVNLELSGNMLASIQIHAESDRVTLSF